MSTARPFERLVCKCERCGHEWIPKSEEVFTCPNSKCRSVFWNKPKDGSQPKEAIILDEKGQAKAALQCAIIQDFDCQYYKVRTPVTALCTTCFVLEFWNTDKLAMLKEAFGGQKEPEKPVVSVQGDEVFEGLQVANSEPEIQKTKEPEPDIPKTPEEAIARLEQNEITGRENSSRTLGYDEMRLACYKCMEKYKDNKGDWQCNFFYFNTNPKFNYCKLCWELAEIWQDRALGPKK
jgi:hypothetical protein